MSIITSQYFIVFEKIWLFLSKGVVKIRMCQWFLEVTGNSNVQVGAALRGISGSALPAY